MPFRISLNGAILEGERRDGTGTPLVLVHGFGGSRHDWAQVLSCLDAGRPVIAYDQRGFGASTSDGQPYSHADDLLALLDALAIDKADLCGLSLGGRTALTLAMEHPERVNRLVLISPLIAGWRWSSAWVERWKAIGRAARSGDMTDARDLWWHHPLFDTLRDHPAAPTMRAAIEAFHGAQWIRDGQRPASSDADRLDALLVPTLLLSAGRDTPDFVQIADAIARDGQDVTSIRYEDAGHMLNLEAPARLAADIEGFLNRQE